MRNHAAPRVLLSESRVKVENAPLDALPTRYSKWFEMDAASLSRAKRAVFVAREKVYFGEQPRAWMFIKCCDRHLNAGTFALSHCQTLM